MRAAEAIPLLRRSGGSLVSRRLLIWRLPASQAERVVPSLVRRGLVRAIERDLVVSKLSTPSASTEPLFEGEWWRSRVGADDQEPPGSGVPVTVIDSGLDLEHPEFAARPDTTLLNAQTLEGTAASTGRRSPRSSQPPSTASGPRLGGTRSSLQSHFGTSGCARSTPTLALVQRHHESASNSRLRMRRLAGGSSTSACICRSTARYNQPSTASRFAHVARAEFPAAMLRSPESGTRCVPRRRARPWRRPCRRPT
jgi:hypothetical protein